MHAYTEALYGHDHEPFLPAYIVLFPYELLRLDRLLELAYWSSYNRLAMLYFSVCLAVRDGLIQTDCLQNPLVSVRFVGHAS